MLYKWIISDTIWDRFYLDPWVYFKQTPAGGWQLVHILFYNRIMLPLERGEKVDLTRPWY